MTFQTFQHGEVKSMLAENARLLTKTRNRQENILKHPIISAGNRR